MFVLKSVGITMEKVFSVRFLGAFMAFMEAMTSSGTQPGTKALILLQA
jgi:hypothetical protein